MVKGRDELVVWIYQKVRENTPSPPPPPSDAGLYLWWGGKCGGSEDGESGKERGDRGQIIVVRAREETEGSLLDSIYSRHLPQSDSCGSAAAVAAAVAVAA